MDSLTKELFKLPIVARLRSSDNDDAHVDRLNHRVTVGLILCGLLISGGTLFIKNRISCWLPAQLKHSSYPKYVENYCFIQNTYYVYFNETPPHADIDRKEAQIGYYQWIPFLLLLMALCFYIPRLIWRSYNIRCGIDIQNIIKKSQVTTEESTIKAVAKVNFYCQSFQNRHSNSPINARAYYRRDKHRGNYLSSLYFLSRILYLINSILQLILLNTLLGHRGTAWFLDIDILRSIFHYGNPLLDSPYFPRVTLCDVPIREIAVIHRYTIQCTLPINILNEKVFLALSFWFSYLIVHNIISFVILISQQFYNQRRQYVKRLTTFLHDRRDDDLDEFTCNYLSYDGLLILRLISHNASELQAMEIAKTLFENYRKSRKVMEPVFDDSSKTN